MMKDKNYKVKMMIQSCTVCRKCQKSCPAQIDIPEALKIYVGYLDGDMQTSEQLNEMQSVGKPIDCIECGACSDHCFNGIDIKKLMRELAMMQSCQRFILAGYIEKEEAVR